MKVKVEIELTFVDSDFGTPIDPPLPIGIVVDTIQTVAKEVRNQVGSRYPGTGVEIDFKNIEEVEGKVL